MSASEDVTSLFKAELNKRKLNQSAFAEIIDVSRQNVHAVLTGQRSLTYDEWERWFGALGIEFRAVTTFTLSRLKEQQGFFKDRADLVAWVGKRVTRKGHGQVKRRPKEIEAMLNQAGLTDADMGHITPATVAPLMQSPWLEGGSADHLADQLKANLQKARSGQSAMNSEDIV